ncbi:Gfo/Idh/MocA family protein [Marinicrinis sediminis]|uniref:Gfo/Idh/MocA family protein n=1 Tax=Marinicrinis sediminis TaxID=1652465 RepID=A0ABW5R8R9_9BACL
MNKRTFAIIGCQHAHISIFIEEMLALGHVCKGIYERENHRLAEQIARKYDLPIVASLEELEQESIDLIGCAAINNEKIDIMEWCEQFGKPIMIDKPAVTNRDGLKRLSALISRNQLEIGMLLTERYRPSVSTLKRRIAEGRYGTIVHISMRKPHMLRPEDRPDWHFSKEQSGGIINDLFVHDIDLLRWLLADEICEMQAFRSKRILPEYPDFYDAAGLQIKMQGGGTAQLYADWHTPESCWTYGDGRIFVTGTEGTAELRLSGDPLRAPLGAPVEASTTLGQEAMFEMTHTKSWHQVEIEAEPSTLTKDYLARLDGRVCSHTITAADIYLASKATVEADEGAIVIHSTGVSARS